MDVTIEELSQALDLQRRAYETLVWLDLYSLAHPELLDAQTAAVLADPQACAAWVRRSSPRIPARWRPSEVEMDMFARLFASFFQTSYTIERREFDGKPYYRLRANKELMSAKERSRASRQPAKHRLRRRMTEAHELKTKAIEALAKEANAADDVISAMLRAPEYQADVTLWTYACELISRARGGCHGPAVYLLWREMDAEARTHLTAETVWISRDRLLFALARK